MLEKDIQNQILKWLNGLDDCYAIKITGGMYQRGGVSDILACHKGRFIAFEVKRPGKDITPLQRAFLAHINNNGGIARKVESVSEAMEALKCL